MSALPPRPLAGLLLLAAHAAAECARGDEAKICSGRGFCDETSPGVCAKGFEGPACEQRTCPSGKAWTKGMHA